MATRVQQVRGVMWSTLTRGQRRGVTLLVWLSIIIVIGLTITGIWQFFTHEPDPGWYGFTPGTEFRPNPSPSTGMAELHSLFGDAAFAVALIGGALFAYKVSFSVPWFGVAALGLAFVGLVTGSLVRFNLVKLEGKAYEEAGNGYAQLFSGELEYVVTARATPTPGEIWVLVGLHILLVPVLVAGAWRMLGRVGNVV